MSLDKSFKYFETELGVKRASQEERTRTKWMESENSGVDFKLRMIEGK